MNTSVKNCNFYKALPFILSFFLSTNALSKVAPPVTYGDLIMMDEEGENHSHNQVSLIAGFDSNDPLLDTYSGTLLYSYQFYSFWDFGVMGRFFSSKKTALLKTVDSQFGLLGVQIESERPQRSYYLRFGVIPLKGRLNFFGLKTLLYNFSLHLGPGQRITDRSTYWGYYWAIQSTIGLTKSLSLLIVFDQEAEAGLAARRTVFRDQTNIGFSYLF